MALALEKKDGSIETERLLIQFVALLCGRECVSMCVWGNSGERNTYFNSKVKRSLGNIGLCLGRTRKKVKQSEQSV